MLTSIKDKDTKRDSTQVPEIDLINLAVSTEANTTRSPDTTSANRANLMLSSLTKTTAEDLVSRDDAASYVTDEPGSPTDKVEEKKKGIDAYFNEENTDNVDNQLLFLKRIIDENIGIHDLRR